MSGRKFFRNIFKSTLDTTFCTFYSFSNPHLIRGTVLFAVSERKTRTVHSTEAVVPPHFSVPFIVSVCGGVLLLIFISAFGIVVKFGEYWHHTTTYHYKILLIIFFMVIFHEI